MFLQWWLRKGNQLLISTEPYNFNPAIEMVMPPLAETPLPLAEITAAIKTDEMLRYLLIGLTTALTFCNCSSQEGTAKHTSLGNSITKVEMNLSAFGVEADNFPSIAAYIDFVKDSSNCQKTYYNPDLKPSTYKLSGAELKQVLRLLMTADLSKLKEEYSVSKTDQPTSTTIIYTGGQTITIKDYGLEGDYPLKELYKIV